MIYTKKFSVDDFEWSDFPRNLVERIRKAGKADELSKILEEEFDSEIDTFSDHDIDSYVSSNAVEIMKRLGLTIEGKPIRKIYKVFYRVTAVSHEEIEAGDPEEAREKFLDEFYPAPGDGDPLLSFMRDEVESAVPVAYEEGDDGQTVDYGPSEEARKELENSLVGVRIFALVRVDKDECGTVETPSVRLFASFEEAKQEMLKDYRFAFGVYDRSGNVDSFMPIEDGVVTCYVHGKDGTEAKWNIIEVLKGIERSNCVSS